MNRIVTVISVLALAGSFAGCKNKDGDAAGGGAGTTEAKAPAKAPTTTINDADWVAKDLHEVAPMIHVTMRVPKDAKLEKNGNGGVDVHVNDVYMLTVSAIAVSNIAEGIESDKSMTVGRADQYINTKLLVDEPTGFVYTVQLKDEENGTKYEPETHFAHYLDKEGAIYSILDQRPMEAFGTPGSAYPPELATKVYAIIKGSAKAD
jgi:hypothetical protein